MLEDEKKVAVQAAKEAGSIILSYYEKDKMIEAKGQSYNLVTEADYKAENLIVSMIKDSFPGHSILAEEKGTLLTESQCLWVIDPLDGTNNYAHSFPFFAVSVALWIEEKPVLGVAYDPIRDELFFAQQGCGAFVNGKPIKVSASADLTQSILATGFHFDRGAIMRATLQQIEAFFAVPIQGIRRTGSAVLDQCYVAAGKLDGFWELTLKPWDYAAGSLIVAEAGGKVTNMNGDALELNSMDIMVSNGKVHEAMLGVVKSVHNSN